MSEKVNTNTQPGNVPLITDRLAKMSISHIIYTMGEGNVSLWSGFKLSKEDEEAIRAITEEYCLHGCSVAGTSKDIASEIVAQSIRDEMDTTKKSTKIAMRQVRNTLLSLMDECNMARIKAEVQDDEAKELYVSMQTIYGFLISMIPDIPITEDTPSAEKGNYSPSAPWNAPGMSVSDFI